MNGEPILTVDEIDRDFDRINEHKLFQEWNKHPQLVRKYAEKLAQAKRELADAEDWLLIATAEADQEIRNNTEEKITEAAIKQEITLHVKVKKGRKQVIEKQAQVDSLSAIMKTLDNRKTAMEEMVKLMLGGLYASPKLPPDANEKWERQNRKKLRSGV